MLCDILAEGQNDEHFEERSSSKCEIRPSPVHGNGVFALQDIPEETELCYYDGQPVDPNTVRDHTYLLDFDGKTLDGYRVPRTPEGIGQFINDGASLQPEGDLHTVIEHALEYLDESSRKSNVIFTVRQGRCVAVANRAIKKDEELFFSYEIKYWLNSQVHELHRQVICFVEYLTDVAIQSLLDRQIDVDSFSAFQEAIMTEMKRCYREIRPSLQIAKIDDDNYEITSQLGTVTVKLI